MEGTTPKEINISHGLFIIEGESGIRVIGACSANSTTVTTIVNGYSSGYGTFSMSKSVWGKLVVSQSGEVTKQFTAYCIG